MKKKEREDWKKGVVTREKLNDIKKRKAEGMDIRDWLSACILYFSWWESMRYFIYLNGYGLQNTRQKGSNISMSNCKVDHWTGPFYCQPNMNRRVCLYSILWCNYNFFSFLFNIFKIVKKNIYKYSNHFLIIKKKKRIIKCTNSQTRGSNEVVN